MGKYFIGIPIPSDVKKKIKAQSWSGLSRYKDEKLVPHENWHLTLAFIGHLDEEKLYNLKELLKVFSWGSSFKIGIRNFGGFPSQEETKIIWLGVDRGQKEIRELAQVLRRQLDHIEIDYDDKDFIPHLTLARLRSSKNTCRLKENGKMKQEIIFKAEEIILYDSEKEKNPYAVIENIPLT